MSHGAPGRGTRLVNQFLSGLPPHARASLAVRVVAVGLEFASLLVLARLLPSETYGVYVLMMSCVAIGAVPATLGFDRLLVREAAAALASRSWSSLKGLLQGAVHATVAGAAVVSVALIAISTIVLTPDDSQLALAMLLAAVLIPVVAFVRLRQATLQGLGHVVVGQLPEAIVQPATLILLTLAAAIVLQVPRTPFFPFGLQLASAAAALAFAAILLQRSMPHELSAAVPDGQAGKWLGTGLAFMWLVAMSALHANVDIILVGALAGPAEAGVYRVASQLAMFVGLPLTAVSMAMAPTISALHATGRHDELRRRLAGAARGILACAAPVAILVVLLGPTILAAFGTGFARGYEPAIILTGAYVFHSAMATSSYVLFMTGHERTATLAFAAGVIFNVTGNLLLTPTYGILGAAIATSISLCVVSATCAVMAWRHVGINATVFSRLNPEPAA